MHGRHLVSDVDGRFDERPSRGGRVAKTSGGSRHEPALLALLASGYEDERVDRPANGGEWPRKSG